MGCLGCLQSVFQPHNAAVKKKNSTRGILHMCQDAYERLPRSRPAGSKETEGMDARFKNGTWVPHRFHVQSYLGCLCASNIATSLQNMLQPGAPQTVTCMWITSSVQFSRSVESDPLRPHGLQHTRFPSPSPSPGAYSSSCQFSQWCHPTISSSELQSPEELVNLQIWIPWVLEGPKSRSFQQAPRWSHCQRSVDHTRHCKATAMGRGAGGSGESAIQSCRPLLHYKHEMMHCIRCDFLWQLLTSTPSLSTQSLHRKFT